MDKHFYASQLSTAFYLGIEDEKDGDEPWENPSGLLAHLDLDLYVGFESAVMAAYKAGRKFAKMEKRAEDAELRNKYPKPEGFAGLQRTVPNKVLGYGWLSLYVAEDAGLDPDGGSWVTVCETHGALCNHRTLRLANGHLGTAGWCEACTGTLEE